jgi:hypothetical protein
MKSQSLFVLIPLLAMVGCVKAPIEGRADTYTPAQINFVDQDLRDNTAIGRVKLSRDESNLLHVDVPIRATTNLQLYVDYRVTFLDANGSPLGPASGWTSTTIPPNVWQDILVNSASPRAADFHMDLRYAR